MAPIHNLYIISFNPLGTLGPTILTTAQKFNKMYKHIKWGSSVTPYPDLATIYCRLVISNPGDDMFEDIYLDDMWVSCCVTIVGQLTRFCRVQANKRISHHCLLDNHVISGNLRGLLECSTQVARDAKKVYDNTI
jgi:hypothetical protein